MSTDETQNYQHLPRPANTAQTGAREVRLDEVLAAYLRAAQAGETPDQQEWLARYPDLAPELTEFFADREHLERLARPMREAVTHGPPLGSKVRYIGDYELLEEWGRGGMGVVYKARQVSLKRLVALKMILAGSHAGPQDLARFRAEAEAVARLQHPGIVQIFEVGEHDGLPYLALEFVEGGSLDRKLAGTPQPARQAALLMELLARAVHAAHQQGVVHRDLKPANILLALSDRPQAVALGGPGTVQRYDPKITDFGLAKLMTEEAGPTRSGSILGTPSYMAPEQARGQVRELGPAPDIYALGSILYELLTGRPPFKAETPLQTIKQVVSEEPVPPRQLNPSVPRDLETVCLKCLEKEPAQRYASASALAEDLARFHIGEPVLARPVGRTERSWRWCRRNPVVASLSALVLLSLVTGTLVSGLFYLDASQQAQLAFKAQKREERKAEDEATARRQAEQQLLRAEWLLYANQLARARSEWDSNNVTVVKRQLFFPTNDN